jgi:hypothetical protein
MSPNLVSLITKHQKEQALSPELEKLGFTLEVIAVDTDTLGTFSGEIERKKDVWETLEAKINLGHTQAKGQILLASEGSFGPHPEIPWLTIDEECLLWFDHKTNQKIKVIHRSTDTNYSFLENIKAWETLETWAKSVDFPEHGVILCDDLKSPLWIEKEIRTWHELSNVFEKGLRLRECVCAQTDMRAHKNPKRMRVIADAAKILVQKLQSCCPSCKTPGFDVVKKIPGLPCQSCGMPTKTPISALWKCDACGYEIEKKIPRENPWENPMYCDFCNP